MEVVMNKLLIVAVSSLALAGCTVREQQLATAGVAGALVGAAIAQPQPRPVYVDEPRTVYVVPPRRPRCYMTWENTYRGYVERRVCDRY
jgi:hypothetical protein